MTFPDATLCVLAGGRSTRMGTDKALVTLAGRPMIAWVLDLVGDFEDAVVIAPRGEGIEALGVRLVPDVVPGLGPVGGVATALAAASTTWALVVGCDMPRVNLDLARALWAAREGASAVVPRAHAQLHPLFSLWRTDLAQTAHRLAGAESSMHELVETSRAQVIAIDEGLAPALMSVNTQGDLWRARDELEKRD